VFPTFFCSLFSFAICDAWLHRCNSNGLPDPLSAHPRGHPSDQNTTSISLYFFEKLNEVKFDHILEECMSKYDIL
jgi:hypothetical protein